ncbi:hypothetical protein ABH923_000817 [Leifsonia sp. EB41]|uniref:hypothetical protein n=1 Tax=Leifsonia sp. EB41 TaxID=3156260 RepID=UPI00351176B9
MNQNDHRTLGELEDAQRDESATARRRIEQADEYVSYYRSRMRSLEEGFFELASRYGGADDPRLRAVFAEISHDVDENVRAAGAVVARLDEDYRELQLRHARDVEDFREKG